MSDLHSYPNFSLYHHNYTVCSVLVRKACMWSNGMGLAKNALYMHSLCNDTVCYYVVITSCWW